MQPLEACQGCYTQKLSCPTARRGVRKKADMEERDVKALGESSESEGEGEESRREWLSKFSTMKVGPLKHVKPMTELKSLGLEAKVTAHRVMSRLAGLEVKKRLEKLCEHLQKSLLYQTNGLKFLPTLWISIMGLRALLLG